MKKTVIYISLVILILSSCQEDTVVSDGPHEMGAIYEEIMNENQAWQISKVESDKPRTFEFSYIKTDDEGFPLGIDSVFIKSDNWLGQFEQASTYDPRNYRTGVLVKFDFSYSQMFTSSMYLEYKLPNMEEFETISIGESKTVDDLTTFEIDVSILHKYFYGYNNLNMTIDQEDDKETWTKFKASREKISFQVDKTYRDTTYTVDVVLIPAN
jgi:hypothetical protein